MMDFIKAAVILAGYGLFAPVCGIVLARHQKLEDAAMLVLVFLLGLHIDQTVVMLNSIEWYRGVTKGYEFSMMEVVAISLIVSALARKDRKFIWLPIGTLLWATYVFASSISVFTSIEPNYALMNVVKFGKVWLIVYATANYVRSPRHVHVVLTGVVIMIVYQFLFVAKMKWIDGHYQVRGLFEHQNPLAMFTYLAVLPLLAVALSPAVTRFRSLLYLAGFGCGGIIILATLSRGALAFFAMGIAAVVLWGFLDRFTLRRLGIASAIVAVGAVGLSFTLATIISRFQDEGNEASGETRVVMNLAAKAMLEDQPVGIGWNNFGIAINHPHPYGDVIDQWNLDRGQNVDLDYAKGVVESHYWLLLAETGYQGLVTYLIFIALIALHNLRTMLFNRASMEAALHSGILIACGLTYVHSSLERVLTQTKNLGLWMVFIGLTAATIAYIADDKKRQASEPTEAPID